MDSILVFGKILDIQFRWTLVAVCCDYVSRSFVENRRSDRHDPTQGIEKDQESIDGSGDVIP